MATIVRHKNTGRKYALLGAGFGAYKATRPSFFGGNLFPNEDEGTIEAAAVSDSNGIIYWIPTNELQVLEIDGKSISDIVLKE